MPRKSTFTSEYRRLCLLLRNARKQAGLTQQEMARRLDRPQSYVSKYEKGERRLDVVEFLHIAKVIRIDACLLLKKLTQKR